jgi:uncharacterized protein (TIGR02466 family)
MEVFSIFPTAIGYTNIDRELTAAETKFIAKVEKTLIKNIGNSRSSDTFVLNNPAMSNVKKWINEQLYLYLSEANPMDQSKTSIYITQSWINFSQPGEWHHSHYHRNAFLSGVFYINANIDQDKITFKSPYEPSIAYTPTSLNTYNTDEANVLIKTGDLVLFPARMHHMVGPNERNQTRISLSFNTFLRGELDSTDRLTNLSL